VSRVQGFFPPGRVRVCPRITGKLRFARATHRGVQWGEAQGYELSAISSWLMVSEGGIGGLKGGAETAREGVGSIVLGTVHRKIDCLSCPP